MTARLLVVVDELAGGLAAVAAEHAAWFRARGWDVSIAAPSGGDVVVPVPRRGRDLRATVHAGRVLRRLLAPAPAPIVHCHGLRSASVAFAAGVRPVVTLHGAGRVPSDPPGNHALRGLGLSVVPRLARAGFTAAPEWADGRAGSGWRFAPHASPRLGSLDVVAFPAGDRPVIAWIGRLDEPKDPVRFVRELAATGALGLVAGSGPLEARVRGEAARLAADVEFLGEVPDPSPVLARCWAVALYSAYEAVPFALQEAMWAGRAVVADPLPGIDWLAGPVLKRSLAEVSGRAIAMTAGREAARRARDVLEPDAPWPFVERTYRALR